MNKYENMATQQQKKDKAWVIWNISICPIPDGVDPSLMGTTIQKVLESAGHVRRYDQISITAFGNNLTEIPGEDVTRKLYSTGISLMHGTEYQTELLIWYQRNPPPATMMIIDSHERLGVGWLASTLSKLEDEGYTILLAYPQCDVIAKPLQRSFSKQWYWPDLVSDEQKTITSLDLKEDCYERIVFCSFCAFKSQTFEDLPTHLKTEGHAYAEWNQTTDDSVDCLNLANLHLGRSEEWDIMAAQDFFITLKSKYRRNPAPSDQNKELDILAAKNLLSHLREKYGLKVGYLLTQCFEGTSEEG